MDFMRRGRRKRDRSRSAVGGLLRVGAAGLALFAAQESRGQTSPLERIASRTDTTRPAPPVVADPVAAAKLAIADCKARYASVKDYTCTFVKREVMNGKLGSKHVMQMKARTDPSSIYFKFVSPNKGREVIYVAGRNGGKVVAHDVGIGKLLAGTMTLNPKGSMAMEDNRHPVTDAGIGALIETISRHWNAELKQGESLVTHNPNMQIGPQRCTMIETVHPLPHPNYLFHKVRVYIDRDLGLPIRFEAYAWPRSPGAEPQMMEEYTYVGLRLNVGLKDIDFDPNNSSYAFGRL